MPLQTKEAGCMKKKVVGPMLCFIFIIGVVFGTLYAVDHQRMKNNEPVVFSTWGAKYAPPEEEHKDKQIEELYNFKDVLIGNASKVRTLVDKTNLADYPIDGIELKTDAEPYGLTVNFMVDNRKNYRNIDENSLNRMSGLIFSLVKNVDEIRYNFYDAYSDKNNKDDVFYGAYYNRENLCEIINNSKITEGYIETSTVDYKTFEEYYNTLMSTEVAVQNSEFTDAVNEFIGEDYEVVVNSGFGTEIVIDDLSEADEKLLGEFFSRAIGKYSGAGITANLTVYDIRNFKTDEYGHCAFLHYTHPDEGLVMIGEKILNDGEYEEIRNFLIKKSSN